MEPYQNQSGAQQTHPQLDQYGNPVLPIGTGAYGGAPVMAGHHNEGGGGLSGMLHRSGSSSSSSSSEDDGLGGRRKKKGITAKIKEKLPGHHGSHQTSSATGTIPVYDATGTVPVHHEKKGIMEKIKEKLPGTHH
ncbi:unnamed protein product [Eruca vesicaria subsp. sativa]|uniref:Dehydrin n=1 Tax=Eruca vesicaria subsp. sativa TaxID=29727 RepID=A0ABC8L0E8_ERUVS|nr:unnamed protein product [Eruca vesicaria subsp. sativa]